MKKCNVILVSLLASVLLVSCYGGTPVTVKDNKRASITARLVDESGNPIPNVVVVGGFTSNLIGGFDTSDENGIVDFNALENSSSRFNILVNPSFPEFPSDTTHTFISYSNQKSDRQRYFYDFGTLVLKNLATLKIEVDGAIPVGTRINGTVKYESYDCQTLLEDYTVLEEKSFCGEVASSSQIFFDESILELDFNIRPLLGSTAILEYTVNDEIEQIVEIAMNQNLVTYEIEI